MRIKIINTGEIREVNASYGLRLIEQGKAKAAPKPAKPAKPAKSARKEMAEAAGDA